jgi:hypothetical protein
MSLATSHVGPGNLPLALGTSVSNTRKAAWIIAALALLTLAGIAASWVLRPPNRAVILNLSGAEIRQVSLTLTPLGSEAAPLVRSFSVIRAGESRTVAHAFNDFTSVLQFVDADGNARRHATPHIDLWTGEAWVFAIEPGGNVEENYYYPGVRPK